MFSNKLIATVLFLFALAAPLGAPPCWGGISIVQHKSSFSASSASSMTLAYTTSVTSGDLLIGFGMTAGAGVLSFFDNVNGSWTVDISANSGTGSGNSSLAIAHFANSGAGTITVTMSSTTVSDLHLHIYEISGIVTTSPLDATGSSTATASPITVTTSASVAQSNELVIAGAGNENTNSTWTISTSGWTLDEQSNNTSGGDSAASGTENATTGLSGTQSVTFTYSTAGTNAAVIATYKGTSGAPPPCTNLIALLGAGCK